MGGYEGSARPEAAAGRLESVPVARCDLGPAPPEPDGRGVEWLESVLESMPQAVLYADERGRVRANRAARALALVGVPGGGQPVVFRARTREGREVPWERSPLMRALVSGETISSEELVLDAPDGRTVSVLAWANPVGDAARRRGAVAVFQDVTALRTVVRMREKWISVIAHELRQPLGTMLIALGALGRAQELSRPCPDAVTRMRTAIGRLDRMIDDLLDKARIDTRKIKIALETVDLARLAGDIVARASHLLLDCPVKIERTGDEALAVAADPDRIEQILLNLLSNAAKYGSPRGEIGLRLEANGREVVVAVRNGGRGLTAEECRRVFDREYRTASSEAGDRSGLGLGLYIAKGLVEAQGGRIWVESLPGAATTFSFALPRHVARVRGTG